MIQKCKLIFKRFVVIWAIICVLLPVFSGYVMAADEISAEGYLNSERAGNYAANFAINFYENWSSIQTVKTQDSSSSGSSNGSGSSGVLAGGQKIYDEILLGNTRVAYVAISGRDAEQIANNRSYSENSGMDCSTFVSAALWLAGYEEFKTTQNTYMLEDGCLDGHFVRNYGFEIYRTDRSSKVYQLDENGNEHEVSGVTADTFMQPGDIIVVNKPGRSNGHTNIVKEVRPNNNNKYLALDCGDSSNWQNTAAYNNAGGGLDFDIWSSHGNWDRYYGGTNQAFLIRAGGTSSSSGINSKTTTYGEIKTEYNSEKSGYDIPNEDDAKYELSNISWITMVYKYSLNREINNLISGSGNSIEISPTTFDSKTEIQTIKDAAGTSEYIDATELMSHGKILPGDILYADKGDGTGEYLLYVGGTKIIYATQDPLTYPSGALKYEYMEYYLRRVRDNLRVKTAEAEGKSVDDVIIPKYGVTKVFRINSDVAKSIPETDATLFFNGKGYFSKVTYEGIPDATIYSEAYSFNWTWIIDVILKVLEFLVNLIVYIIRMQVIAIVTLTENLLQNIILGATGDNHSSGIEAFFGPSATSASGERITVESIFFNQIPIFDANFFNYETAGGYDLSKSKNDFVYLLRKNLNTVYIIMRSFSIALMLLILIVVGIRIALTSIAEKKAEYKQFLISWVYAFCVILFMHLFMYLIFMVNDNFVNLCKEFGQNAGKEIVAEELQNANSTQEINLYDAVRTKAYAFSWKEGVPATIVYIYLVYLLVRFSFIYYKRYLTIYLLAVSSTFIGAKYAIDRLMGKKTNSLNKWFKDFAFNVLLQTVHAFIYVIFMAVAISVSQESVGGAVIAVVILNFMLKADQLIIKIFGLDKAGSLQEVNKPESWSQTVKKLMPIYSITAGAIKATNGLLFFGQNGLVKRIAYMTTGADNRKDADKILEMRKYKFLGWKSRVTSAPIRGIGILLGNKRFKRLGKSKILQGWKKYQGRYGILGGNLSYDTNKKRYKETREYVKQRRQKFTRKIGTFADLTLGKMEKIAAIGVAIGDPTLAVTLHSKGKDRINKHKTLNKTQRKMDRYAGTKGQARQALGDSTSGKTKKYNDTLEEYVTNQDKYNREYNKKLDEIANAKVANNQNEVDKLMAEARELIKQRRKQEAVELDKLQQAYEGLEKAKKEYANSKHEKNSRNIVGKAFQKVVRAGEVVTGLDSLDNIVYTDSRQAFKTSEGVEKGKKKMAATAEAIKLEKEYIELVQKLKDKIKQSMANATSEEQIAEFNKLLDETTNMARNADISSNTISTEINEYMYKHNINKITLNEIDLIVDNINDNIKRKTHKDLIDNKAKDRIKEKLQEKMIKDSKGLGLETKDATALIREVIGEEGMMIQKHDVSAKNDEIKKLQNKILRKNAEIRTHNQVGKTKHGSNLINLNKVIKETRKNVGKK